MSDEPKDQRIPIMMSASEVEAIDDWGFKRRIRTRAEAVRRLCQIGLAFDDNSAEIPYQKLDDAHKKIVDLYTEIQSSNDLNDEYIKALTFYTLNFARAEIAETQTYLLSYMSIIYKIMLTPDSSLSLKIIEDQKKKLQDFIDRQKNIQQPNPGKK